MSNTIERLSAIMGRRKHPASADQIAAQLGVAPKTVRNYFSTGKMMDKWLEKDNRVVSILNRKTGQRKYMVVPKSKNYLAGDTFRIGKREFVVVNADSYRIDVMN